MKLLRRLLGRPTSPPAPTPPTNVRFETWTGTEIPVECVYDGRNSEGLHQWVAVSTVPCEQVRAIRADTIPARTSIVLGMTSEEDAS